MIQSHPVDEPHKTPGQLNDIRLHHRFSCYSTRRTPHSVRLDVLLSWANTFGIYKLLYLHMRGPQADLELL